MIYAMHTPQRNRIQGKMKWISGYDTDTRRFTFTDDRSKAHNFDLSEHDFVRSRTGSRVVGHSDGASQGRAFVPQVAVKRVMGRFG
jgi:hypothetical protein